jgi:hypothetical protein
MSLTEPILREQLRGVIQDEIAEVEMSVKKDCVGADGKTTFARDDLIRVYSVRLMAAGEDGKPKFRAMWRQLVRNLCDAEDDEEIWFWTVNKSGRRVDGLSTPKRLIGIIDFHLSQS